MRGDIKSNTQLFNICLTKDHLNYNRCCRLMDSSTEEVGLILPVFSEYCWICFVMSDLLIF